MIRDYASNITINYGSKRSRTPLYYNQVGPGAYNIPTLFGNKTQNDKFHNPPAFKIGTMVSEGRVRSLSPQNKISLSASLINKKPIIGHNRA